MNLISLTLKNFRSYGPSPQTINLTDIDTLAVCGDNGSGKSSIIDALTFALYGKAAVTEVKELGLEALINDKADEAFVSVTIEKDHILYTIDKILKRKGQARARLTSPILQRTVVDVIPVTQKIESILGMDYETFVSSTIIRQNEMDRLTAKRPAERKEILTKIFGLQIYEMLREQTKEKIVQLNHNITSLETEKRILNERLDEENKVHEKKKIIDDRIHRSEKELAEEETNLKNLLQDLTTTEEKKRLYDMKKIELDTFTKSISEIQTNMKQRLQSSYERLNILNKEIKEATSANLTIKKVQDQLAEKKILEKESEKKNKRRDTLNAEIASLKQEITNLLSVKKEEKENYEKILHRVETVCPLCKRPLDTNHRNKLIYKYEKRLKKIEPQITQHQNNFNELTSKVGQINYELVKIDDALKDTSHLLSLKGSLEEKVRNISKLESEKKGVEEEVVNIQNEAKVRESSLINQIQTVKREIDKLKPMILNFQELNKYRLNEETKIRELTGEIAKLKTLSDTYNEKIRDLKNVKMKLNEVETTLKKEVPLIGRYKILEQAFHKDGIPTAILIELVPEIEKEASKILRELSDGRMDIHFRFGRTTKSGKTTEELIIEVVDVQQDKSFPIGRYSGGERMRVNLALRLGVSEVIAKRSGYKGRMETLIIDEGFGALDEQGRKGMIEILRMLRGRFKKVVIISHVEDVKEAFEFKLWVMKPPYGYSKIIAI